MSSQIGAVEVTITANIEQYQRNLATAANDAANFQKRIEQNVKQAVPQLEQYGKAFDNAGKVASRSTQAVAQDMQNLRFQMTDIASGLISGGSPFMVLSQQAGQFSDILSKSGGLRGAFTLVGQAAMSMVNPVNLAIAGFAAAVYAATSFFSATEDGAEEAEAALKRHEEVLKRVKDAYGEAAAAAIKYGDDSKDALNFDTQLNAAEQAQSLMDASKAFLDEVGTMTRGGFRVNDDFNQFADAIREFRDSVQAGQPDVEGFRDRIREIAADSPQSASGILEIAKALITAAERAREASAALEVVTKPTPSYFEDVNVERARVEVQGAPRPPKPPNRLDYDPDGFAKEEAEKLRKEQEREAEKAQREAERKFKEHQRKLAQAAKEQAREIAKAQEEAQRAAENFGKAIEDVFIGIVQGGDAAKQALIRLAAEMLRSALIGEGQFAGWFKKGGLLAGGSSAGGASSGASMAQTIDEVANNLPAGSEVSGAGAALAAVASGSGGRSVSPMAGTDMQTQAWNFWASKGLSPEQIAGVMGNIHAESAFNPSAIGDGGRAHGLYQHHPDRRAGISGFLGDPMKQHELAWQELQGPENRVWNQLLKAKNVEQSTAAFIGFERPQGWSPGNPQGGHGWATRLQGAEAALAKFGQTTTVATEGLGSLGTGMAGVGEALTGALGGLGGATNGSGGGGGFGSIIGAIIGLIGGGFAKGGVSSSPAIFGEAGPEAAVPLPDGRSIPVKLTERAGGVNNFAAPTIVINGNADSNTTAEIDSRLRRFQKDLAKQMDDRDKNRWRTN